MGAYCCGTKPPEKFVGTWTNNNNTELTIDENGAISYQKQTPNSSASFAGRTRYKDDEFCFCCCCLSLRGTYTDQAGGAPKLIADGVALTKK